MKDVIQYSSEQMDQNVQLLKDKLAELMNAVNELRKSIQDEDTERKQKLEEDIEGLSGMIHTYRNILRRMDYAAHAYEETENSIAKLTGGLLHDD